MHKGLVLIFLLILILNIGQIIRAEELNYNDDWDYGVLVILYGSQYGTGFWVSRGWVVTAAHVVSFQSYGKVLLIHGDFESYGTVVYVDVDHDVAIIKADSTPTRVHYFKIASSIEKGMRIYAIGYPYELYVLYGDIRKMSANPRGAQGMITWIDYDAMLAEIQAPIDQGNSGGPVISSSGAVVGLVSFAMQGKVGSLYFISTCDAIREALQRARASYQLDTSFVSLAEEEGGNVMLAAFAGALAGAFMIMLAGVRKRAR